jgi:hypothetical protein
LLAHYLPVQHCIRALAREKDEDMAVHTPEVTEKVILVERVDVNKGPMDDFAVPAFIALVLGFIGWMTAGPGGAIVGSVMGAIIGPRLEARFFKPRRLR